jgi:hypothetical protein
VPAVLNETQLELQLKAIGEKKTAYQIVFGTNDPARLAAVQAVLNDLRKFCRADQPTYMTDARDHALLEGRREVWLHIVHWRDDPEEDLLQRIVGDSGVVVKVEPDEEDTW